MLVYLRTCQPFPSDPAQEDGPRREHGDSHTIPACIDIRTRRIRNWYRYLEESKTPVVELNVTTYRYTPELEKALKMAS